MSKEKKIQQSINSVQLVGTIEEINLMVENTVTKKDGTVDKRGARVTNKEFSNPSLTISCNGQIYGVYLIPQYEKKEDENGKLVENPRFKAAKTIMDYEKGTRVKVEGSLSENGYVGQDGEWKSTTRIQAFSVSSTNVSDEDSTDARISGIIKSIKEEMRNDEETGRLLVELYSFDYTGATFPTNLVVEKDLAYIDEDGEEQHITAEDFTEAYSKGDSVILNVEFNTVTVGGGNSEQKTAFGRKSKIVHGFTRTEIRVVGGDEPIEEPDDEEELTGNDRYYITSADIKKALADRNVMIEAKKEEKKNNPSSSSDTAKKGLGRKSKVEVEDEIDDDPFA